MKNKTEIDICLDEIETSLEKLPTSSEESAKELMGWIRKNKLILKTLKYKGKMPRAKRNNEHDS